MKKSQYFYYPFLLLIFLACSTKKELKLSPNKVIETNEASISYFDNYDDLSPLFSHEDDTLRVINFWATWCKPCIEELPYFTELDKEFKQSNQPIKVILISLDLKEKNLVKYINKNKIETSSIWLDDANSNYWIGAIEKDWDGAIPITLLIKGKNRKLHLSDFESKEEIKTFINSI
ncbi:TlpA family protein disulfide reductase [Flammeovirga pacifica]|uniref:Thioredoxin domain-containing protein n=1 Tax=Flammeovirga pacifica TaxID=915059 RepID=A0A1S1YTG5_FLAPC|nr:TlpA disulfide reductase family protein [Flammeovirga pacifica]OHX64095.1 hypothetical protein NH26_21040 [Flammeovirga pacifica]